MQQDSPHSNVTFVARSHLAGRVGPVVVVWMLMLLIPTIAKADLPLYSLGMGGGVGGLFHEESVGEPLRKKAVGKFSAGIWWMDVTWSRRSRLTFGARVHHLRVGLGSSPRVGTVSLVPAVLTLGYRFEGPAERVYGYLAAGAGIASAKFDKAGYESFWQVGEGGAVHITDNSPIVFEGILGGLVRLSDDFSAEIGIVAVMMDSEVQYLPPPGENGLPAPALGYTVKGRHLAVTLGLRWWFEWW